MTGPKRTTIAENLPATVPFVGPEAQERQRGRPFSARLGANESVFGPSPKAISAIEDAAADAWKYGDPESYSLRQALGTHLGLSMAEIVCGTGIDGLLNSLVRLYVEPGVTVVTSEGAYPTFNYHVTGYGGDLMKVPYVDDREDPESLLAVARDTGARLIYLANPDNPMGSWHSAAIIDEMIAGLPPDCLLVLDEAYVELAPEGTAPIIDTTNPQVVRLRTFSKAYGLAGMRVGYAFGAGEVIRGFEKVRNHFGMSRVSQAAALAALDDAGWLASVQEQVARSRTILSDIARENGLIPLPSATNFVTMDCGGDGDFAKTVLAALIDLDIFVRMPFASPGNRAIRISCGTDEDMDRVRDALPKALKTARASA